MYQIEKSVLTGVRANIAEGLAQRRAGSATQGIHPRKHSLVAAVQVQDHPACAGTDFVEIVWFIVGSSTSPNS